MLRDFLCNIKRFLMQRDFLCNIKRFIGHYTVHFPGAGEIGKLKSFGVSLLNLPSSKCFFEYDHLLYIYSIVGCTLSRSWGDLFKLKSFRVRLPNLPSSKCFF